MKINLFYLLRALLLLIFIGGTIFFYYSSPDELISFIGVENAYTLMFTLAFLGGLTTFSGIPYHAILILLASGGLNPFVLGIYAAGGVMAGDATSYYIGYSGKILVPRPVQRILEKFCSFCLAQPKLLPLGFFLYGSLVPFSNDFIVISMGLAHYPFWKVMIPLGIGNIVFNVSLAYLAIYAYDFLKKLLLF